MDPTPASDLADALGISKNALKKLRDDMLTPGADFVIGQPITYTDEGIKKIRAHLGLPEPPAGPLEPSKAGVPMPAPATTRETLTVLRKANGNPRIVLCLTGDGRQVNLCVKSNANFAPKMSLPKCVQRRNAPSVYDYEGRLPRWKGRF